MAVNAYTQAQFNQYVPRSFQEMLTPVLHVAQQEEELQNKYSESQDKIDAALSMLNPDLDKESYNKLVNFKNSVATAAEDLATKGYVDSGRKSNLLNLKKTYDTDFTNILNQATQRLQAAGIQEQKALQDPTYRYKSARQISVDEGLTNPNIWSDTAVSQGISGAFLQQQVAQQAAALKSEISNSNPTLAKLKTAEGKDLLGQYMMSISQGANPQDVATAIANLTGNINEAVGIVGKMTQLVNNVMATNKVEDIFKYGTNEYGSLLGYASQGLYNAVGGTDRQIVKDERDVMNYQQKLELDKRQFEYNLDIRKAQALQDIANGNQSSPVLIPLLGNVSVDFDAKLDPERGNLQQTSEKLQEIAKIISKAGSFPYNEGLEFMANRQTGQSTLNFKNELKKAGISITNKDGSFKSNAEIATEALAKVKELNELDKKLLIKNKSYVINNPEGLNYALPGLIATKKIIDDKGNPVSFNITDKKGKSKLEDITSGVVRINPTLASEGKLEVLGVSGKKLYIDIRDKENLVDSFKAINTEYTKIINSLDRAGLTPSDLVNSTIIKGNDGRYRMADKNIVLTPLQEQLLNSYVITTNNYTAKVNEITEDILTNKK